MTLAGCSGGSRFSAWGGGQSTGNLQLHNPYQGIQGIMLEFVESMPPETVLIGDKFDIGIRVKNYGAYDIDTGKGEIILNADSNIFLVEGNKLTKNFEVLGRSEFLSEGEEDIILFPIMVRCFDQLKGSKNNIIKTITAISCYDYETKFGVDVCLDPTAKDNINREEIEKICEQQNLSFSGGQGAPIAINRVDANIVPYKNKLQAMVTIELSQVQDGEVYFSESKLSCSDPGKQNRIYADVELRGQKLNCKSLTSSGLPSNVVELKSKVGMLRCQTELTSTEGTFTTPLTINLKYNFKSKIHQKLNIIPPSGELDKVGCQNLESEMKSVPSDDVNI
ncbi:hypothetical protein HON01_02135 [Candidatus Woesearchaeota archaeon]|nr:hypothetical protein [Candidatus Woesearchaeota archaeon]